MSHLADLWTVVCHLRWLVAVAVVLLVVAARLVTVWERS